MTKSDLILPSSFRRTMVAMYERKGQIWLEQLPHLIHTLAERWQLQIDRPFEGLSYNFAAPGRREDGTSVVLKVGYPNDELTREIAALKLYRGQGICRLLEADVTLGAMLLERLEPGHMLTSEPDDEQATVIAAQVMRQLWRPLSPGEQKPFRHVREWAAGLQRLYIMFDGQTGPFPQPLVDHAVNLFADLFASAGNDVLLHGDLHHFNILSGSHGRWLAIDPKGMIGEASFEAYALLKNPLPHIYQAPNLKHVLNRRLDILASELNQDRRRLRDWGIAMSVLSGWWSYEGTGSGWEGALKIAKTLTSC